MKKIGLLVLCVSVQLYGVDPFEDANKLYLESDWNNAYVLYRNIHQKFENKELLESAYERTDILNGHINYADVLNAIAITEFDKGNKEEAKKLLLEAQEHSKHRIEKGDFGRLPLNGEWQGQDLRGKDIVVYSERAGGAFGDTFYMSAMLKYLSDKGARVTFVPQRPLAALYGSTDIEQAQYMEQKKYVNKVVVRGNELPKHDYEIYLWSIAKYYMQETPAEKLFPMEQCLSGGKQGKEFIQQIKQKMAEYKLQHGVNPLVIGMWYQSSANAAADNRFLERNPGADNMLRTVYGLPVIIVNLEGLGKKPINKKEFELLEQQGKLGPLGAIDKTDLDTSHVVNFPTDRFDNVIPFGDTFAIIEWIKRKNGLLIGCDTGLACASAMIKKDSEVKEPSVFIVLNKQADFRWGADTTSPRNWHHSKDVRVFQAQKQGEWMAPLLQMREEIQKRITR